jgi:D-arabinose 1-dehydrogenase-like Zn-dependent alcohol dehydrogenase
MSIAKRFGTVTLFLTRDALAQMGCGTSSSTARSLLVANHRSDRFDVVMETVGKATWGHSIRALKPGGTLVIAGHTAGDASPAELTRVFFLQLSVVGSAMGTRDELQQLIRLCLEKDLHPIIHTTMPLADARDGFQAMHDGEIVGKIVFTT